MEGKRLTRERLKPAQLLREILVKGHWICVSKFGKRRNEGSWGKEHQVIKPGGHFARWGRNGKAKR